MFSKHFNSERSKSHSLSCMPGKLSTSLPCRLDMMEKDKDVLTTRSGGRYSRVPPPGWSTEASSTQQCIGPLPVPQQDSARSLGLLTVMTSDATPLGELPRASSA